jgi:hypothetical protein
LIAEIRVFEAVVGLLLSHQIMPPPADAGLPPG